MNTDHMSGTIRLTPLTPVHIGCGESYTPIDYELRGDTVRVKDVLAFFEANRDNVQFALDAVEKGLPVGDEFIRFTLPFHGDRARPPQPAPRPQGGGGGGGGRQRGGAFHGGGGPKVDPAMRKLMRQSDQKFGKTAPPPQPEPRDTPREPDIQQFVKDPFGKPFIPGSSIKGTLRTAIACHLCARLPEPAGRLITEGLRNAQRGVSPQWAANQTGLNKRLFGRNVLEDFMKAFLVADSAPLDITAGFAVCDVKIMNVFRERFEEKRGVPIRVEAMTPQAGPVTLPFHVDLFRLAHDTDLGKVLRGAGVALLRDKAALEDALREHGRALMEHEAVFYHAQGTRTQEEFFRGLLGEGSACLPLGFGTGWHTKTIGRMLEQHDVRAIRDYFGRSRDGRPNKRMGTPDVELFPKTRKWACSADGPRPIGWVRVELDWD